MIDFSANGPCLSVDLPKRKIGIGLGSRAKALSHSFCYPVMNDAPQVLGLSILVDYLKPQKVCVYNEILSLIASLLTVYGVNNLTGISLIWDLIVLHRANMDATGKIYKRLIVGK